MSIVTANGKSIYPESLRSFLISKDGLKITINYLEKLKINYKPVKGDKK